MPHTLVLTTLLGPAKSSPGPRDSAAVEYRHGIRVATRPEI